MKQFNTLLKKKLLYYRHPDVNLQQIHFLGFIVEIFGNDPNKIKTIELYEKCLIRIGFSELIK